MTHSARTCKPSHGRRRPVSKLVFVNLPVADLGRATAFYEAVGATRNPQFSDHTASCMVFSETIHAMLLTHDKFRQFTPRPIADAKATTEVLVCLTADSRAAVDGVVEGAAAAGASGRPRRAASPIPPRGRTTASCTVGASRTRTGSVSFRAKVPRQYKVS